MKPVFWMVVCVGVSLWMASATAHSQTVGRGGSFHPPGSIGSGGRASGARGVRARAVNPNFNPPGSQSNFQRLNSPGSIGPALNLNPKGSSFRPRSHADSTQPSAAVRSPIHYEAHRAVLVPTQAQLERMTHQNLYVWVRSSVRQLEGELARFENGPEWTTALQLGRIRIIADSESGSTMTDEDRQDLKVTLDLFNKLTADNRYDAVTHLAGFSPLRRSLTELLSADGSSSRSPAAQQNEATGVETPRN
jgi:hypothetical protein